MHNFEVVGFRKHKMNYSLCTKFIFFLIPCYTTIFPRKITVLRKWLKAESCYDIKVHDECMNEAQRQHGRRTMQGCLFDNAFAVQCWCRQDVNHWFKSGFKNRKTRLEFAKTIQLGSNILCTNEMSHWYAASGNIWVP